MGFEAGRTGWTVKGELFAKLVERLKQLPDFVFPPGRHRCLARATSHVADVADQFLDW